MYEEEMYISEIDEIYAFLEWLLNSGKPFGRSNYEERFAEFKAEHESTPKTRSLESVKNDLSEGFTTNPASHRPVHKDVEYLRLLHNFEEAHRALAEFYLKDDEDHYTNIVPSRYPFEKSFDDYLQGIKAWVNSQIILLGFTDGRKQK